MHATSSAPPKNRPNPLPPDFLGNASVRDVRRWRESELVHGRVAMLAAAGFVIGENLEDFETFYVSAPRTLRARNVWRLLCPCVLAHTDTHQLLW